jgi:hypothetical protein
MAQPKKNTARKPATKFPQLQKKLRQLTAATGKKPPKFHHVQRGRFMRDL